MALFRKGYASVSEKIDSVVISHDIKKVVAELSLPYGIVQVFTPIGTTGVALFENDPNIYEDYKQWIETQIPEVSSPRPSRRSGSGRNYAHLRAQLVGHSVQCPIVNGKLEISPWQEIVLFDFDDKPGRREFFILAIGESSGGKEE